MPLNKRSTMSRPIIPSQAKGQLPSTSIIHLRRLSLPSRRDQTEHTSDQMGKSTSLSARLGQDSQVVFLPTCTDFHNKLLKAVQEQASLRRDLP